MQLSGPSSAEANGERFDLVDSGVLLQATAASPLTKSGFDPSQDPITQHVDLLQYNGSCTVDHPSRRIGARRPPAGLRRHDLAR